MKDLLQNKLVEILTGIQTSVGKVSDFALEQLPDIAMQYIKFKTMWYCIEIVLCTIAGVILYKWTKKLWKLGDEYGSELGFVAFLTGTALCVCGIAIISNIYQLCMVTVAPKIWFIYQLVDMVKGMK